MNPLPPNTALLSPTLRALALGLLVETAVPLENTAHHECPALSLLGPEEVEGNEDLWMALRGKCGELSAIVLQADDPRQAAAFLLGYLPRHFDRAFKSIHEERSAGSSCRTALTSDFNPAPPPVGPHPRA
jgi:hypothetical protein